MRAWGRHVVVGLTAVAVAGAVASACAHDDSTIFIYNALAPQAVGAGGTCTFTANPSQPIINSGSLDVSLGSGYTAMFLVGNQMVAQVDPTVPRTETSVVDVQGAVVRITDASGNQLTTYTDLSAGSIPAAAGGTPGYLTVAVNVVNAATVDALFTNTGGLPGSARFNGGSGTVKLVTYSKVFGKTLGGQYVESNEFEFPVSLCSGCGIGFTQADISSLCPAPNCLGGAAGNTSATGPCTGLEGQDVLTDCSICRLKGNPLCDPNDCVVNRLDGGTD